MKQLRWLLASMLSISLISFFVVSCKKDVSRDGGNTPAGQAKLSVYLTDGPYDYQKVLVDIQGIVVKVDTCEKDGRHDNDRDDHEDRCDDYKDTLDVNCDIWDTLSIHAGVYDLLQLQNGVDTLLASGYIPQGRVEKIKIILGPNNSVMVDSVLHPLALRENKNYIYVKIKHEDIDSITSTNFNLYLDFDLARSITLRDGNYWLKPVLKPFGHNNYGEIEGKIRPVKSHGMIQAYNGIDTFYARPDHDEGEFKIRGLKEGNYNLWVDGIDGYRDTLITGINVRRGKETDLGTIMLKK